MLWCVCRYFASRTGQITFAADLAPIAMLSNWILSMPKKDPESRLYHERLAADLHRCRWVEAEGERILDRWFRRQGSIWLFEVYSLVDWTTTAAMKLEETMECETEDFHSWNSYRERVERNAAVKDLLRRRSQERSPA